MSSSFPILPKLFFVQISELLQNYDTSKLARLQGAARAEPPPAAAAWLPARMSAGRASPRPPACVSRPPPPPGPAWPRASPQLTGGAALEELAHLHRARGATRGRRRRATTTHARRRDWPGGAAPEELATQAAPRLLRLLE